MYWTLEMASKLEDAPWPATKAELIDYAQKIWMNWRTRVSPMMGLKKSGRITRPRRTSFSTRTSINSLLTG